MFDREEPSKPESSQFLGLNMERSGVEILDL
jgi:hypothetical protein